MSRTRGESIPAVQLALSHSFKPLTYPAVSIVVSDLPETGALVASAPAPATGPVELRIAIDDGKASLSWRAAGKTWRTLAPSVDVEPLASVHAGLFTGLVVGPYAVAGK